MELAHDRGVGLGGGREGALLQDKVGGVRSLDSSGLEALTGDERLELIELVDGRRRSVPTGEAAAGFEADLTG